MRRALATVAVTGVLTAGAGAAWASGTVAASGMHDRMSSTPMPSMPLSSMPLSSMHNGSMPMSGADMDAMHAEMHAQMRQAMPADIAAACDAAHDPTS